MVDLKKKQKEKVENLLEPNERYKSDNIFHLLCLKSNWKFSEQD